MIDGDDDEDDFAAELYREFLLDHYQNPRNQGELDPADLRLEGDNPSCGDQLTMTGRVKDGRLDDILFRGSGCAISQASASILYAEVKGKTIDEIEALERKDVEELIGMTLRPARVKCGVLGLNTLKHAIRQWRQDQASKAAPPGFSKRGA